MGTPHARCREMHQSSRSASMPLRRLMPGAIRVEPRRTDVVSGNLSTRKRQVPVWRYQRGAWCAPAPARPPRRGPATTGRRTTAPWPWGRCISHARRVPCSERVAIPLAAQPEQAVPQDHGLLGPPVVRVAVLVRPVRDQQARLLEQLQNACRTLGSDGQPRQVRRRIRRERASCRHCVTSQSDGSLNA